MKTKTQPYKHFILSPSGDQVEVTFKPITLELIDAVEKLCKPDSNKELQILQGIMATKLTRYMQAGEADTAKSVIAAAAKALEENELTADDLAKINQLNLLKPQSRAESARNTVDIFMLAVQPTNELFGNAEQLRKCELKYIEACVNHFLLISGMS